MTESLPATGRPATQKSGETSGYVASKIEIAQIQTYERNPRHGRNPEYDRIKDSIRIHGLDQPLLITQRPGATDYIVHAGGNTRLLILKELFAETCDIRFSRVPYLYKEWTCESDVLLAHLRENDLRGSLTFIDKARAVFEAKQLLEAELNIDEISFRQLEKELRATGFTVSSGLISQMGFAVQTLLPLIPKALDGGLGKPQIQRIRAMERAARNIWRRYRLGEENEFDDVFAALCQRYDGLEWDNDVLRGAIEAEIAEVGDTSIHTIRVALDAELAGRKLVIPEPDPEPVDKPAWYENHKTQEATSGASNTQDDPKRAESETKEPEDQSPLDPVETSHPTQDTHDSAAITEPLITTDQSAPTDLKSLRGRAWTLAARLAQRNGIGDLIEPLSGKGLGFVLRDVPDPVLTEQLDEDALSQISMLWWQLAACSEMTFAPLESIVPLLPADSVLRKALEEQDADLLFNSIWTLDPGHTGYRLWHPLNDNDWTDLLNLMNTYRRIRYLAAEIGAVIWD